MIGVDVVLSAFKFEYQWKFKIKGHLNAKLKNYWEKNHFCEKLILEMSDLVRYSPSFRHFSRKNFLTRPNNWIPGKSKLQHLTKSFNLIFQLLIHISCFFNNFPTFQTPYFWIWIHSALASLFKNSMTSSLALSWNDFVLPVTKKWVLFWMLCILN